MAFIPTINAPGKAPRLKVCLHSGGTEKTDKRGRPFQSGNSQDLLRETYIGGVSCAATRQNGYSLHCLEGAKEL